jgi:hypothetical protein
MVEHMDSSRLLKLTTGLLGILVLFAAAFVLPAHKPEPHDVPVGLVGTTAQEQKLSAARPGAMEVKLYASGAEARRAIEHREIYGALVGDRLLIASAASNSVAQALRTAAEKSMHPVSVEDVVPLSKEDPRGSTLNSLFLALIIVSSISIVALTKSGFSGLGLVGAVGLFAVLGGFAVIGLVGEGVGALPGPYLQLSAAAGLAILAIALPIAGLQRLLGQTGAALGGLFFMLLANPASANATAPEMLPDPWRSVSQLMPPGAGGTVLRNITYFDGNATFTPLIVLSAYAATGFALVLLGDALRRRRRHEPDEIPATDKTDSLRRAA